ncbi:MAG: hypothetical protein EOP11_09140 [Proteobacteria bacterium]|nr:MAG: hypothetical protein EOP11_09140 [Pseudomonadota bacterium]
MVAQFDLLRLEPEVFLLVTPPACFVALIQGLENLLFAEDVKIEPVPVPVGTFPVSRRSLREPFFKVEGKFPAIVWPSPVPGYAQMSGSGAEAPESFDFDRIGAGIPWPGLDWEEATPALEAGVLPWIDRNKGCYPGQEVVELSLNVGHPARVLIALEGERRPENLGAAKLLSLSHHEGIVRAFVRVPWNQRATPPAGFQILHGWAEEK